MNWPITEVSVGLVLCHYISSLMCGYKATAWNSHVRMSNRKGSVRDGRKIKRAVSIV